MIKRSDEKDELSENKNNTKNIKIAHFFTCIK